MPQAPHHLPRGAVSVCSGTALGISTEHEEEKGKLTDFPVCVYSGTKGGDSERGCKADFGSSSTTQGQNCKSHPDTVAVHINGLGYL